MSDNLPQVAVLLAAYNGMSWIEEQLASILGQTCVNVSVYISIDPSTDGTEAWCSEYAKRHPNVYLLPSAGPFGGAARNFFRLIRDVNFSAFDYVSFSDQDDIWYPGKLERAVAQLKNGSFDGYSSNVVAWWSNGRRIFVNKAQPQVKWDYFFEAAGPGCTYVLTQRLASAFKNIIEARWDKVQDVKLHDWFCYAFARGAGFRWFIDPVPSMDYRQHTKNQVGVNAGFASAISRVREVVYGSWFPQVELISELIDAGDSLGIVSKKFMFSGRTSFLRLLLQQADCRRRRRDRIGFVVLCILRAIFGKGT